MTMNAQLPDAMTVEIGSPAQEDLRFALRRHQVHLPSSLCCLRGRSGSRAAAMRLRLAQALREARRRCW